MAHKHPEPAKQSPSLPDGWQYLRNATPDDLNGTPPPAAGCFVLAQPRLLKGGHVVKHHEATQDPTTCLALVWTNASEKEIVAQTDGYLINLPDATWRLRRCDTSLAPWLPSCWAMSLAPVGWELPHLKAWFAVALEWARADLHPDLPPESLNRSPRYLRTPRDLVRHAYFMVRHLNLPGSPSEPRGVMDAAGCEAELRDVRDFFERALTPRPLTRENNDQLAWTGYKRVAEWAKLFSVSRNTMGTMLKKQDPRNNRANRQQYRLAIEDLPADVRKKVVQK
jgi:hypothetical protein